MSEEESREKPEVSYSEECMTITMGNKSIKIWSGANFLGIPMSNEEAPIPPGFCFPHPVVPSDVIDDSIPPPRPRCLPALVPIDQNIPPKQHPTRNLRPMTFEEFNFYSHQVRTTAGFDVTATPGAYICSQIWPLNLTYHETMEKCEKLARIAISTFNSRLKDTEGELEFVEVVKAMDQLIRWVLYYLTFKAVNLGNQETNTYQAVVESAGKDGGFQVLRFRLKPESQDSDTNEGTWFWDDLYQVRPDTKAV